MMCVFTSFTGNLFDSSRPHFESSNGC